MNMQRSGILLKRLDGRDLALVWLRRAIWDWAKDVCPEVPPTLRNRVPTTGASS
jgi:hypothetical protein